MSYTLRCSRLGPADRNIASMLVNAHGPACVKCRDIAQNKMPGDGFRRGAVRTGRPPADPWMTV